jgi:hypothetical protein
MNSSNSLELLLYKESVSHNIRLELDLQFLVLEIALQTLDICFIKKHHREMKKETAEHQREAKR